MSEEKKPGQEVVEDMSLEPTDEEKKAEEVEAEKELVDMSLDESAAVGSEDFDARINKLFPDKQFVYVTPTHVLAKLDSGEYTLAGRPLADIPDNWKKTLDDFLKEEEKKSK